MTDIFLLVFVYMGRLTVAGPYPLPECLDLAKAESGKSADDAVCVSRENPRVRHYPDFLEKSTVIELKRN